MLPTTARTRGRTRIAGWTRHLLYGESLPRERRSTWASSTRRRRTSMRGRGSCACCRTCCLLKSANCRISLLISSASASTSMGVPSSLQQNQSKTGLAGCARHSSSASPPRSLRLALRASRARKSCAVLGRLPEQSLLLHVRWRQRDASVMSLLNQGETHPHPSLFHTLTSHLGRNLLSREVRMIQIGQIMHQNGHAPDRRRPLLVLCRSP
mmetsp:Transcript_32079/g.62647  ORF Transcript_32079/g.62647 Transcript_32079/m.62647 type:complete len:211 (-) Transcript_32079:44-676(-)